MLPSGQKMRKTSRVPFSSKIAFVSKCANFLFYSFFQIQYQKLSRIACIFKCFLIFHFLMKILVTVLGENSTKFKVIGNDNMTHYSTQFFMLIPNMVILFSKILV